MFVAFQMKAAVDKEVKGGKISCFAQIYKNFSGIFRYRKAQNVGGQVSPSVSLIKLFRQRVAAEN
jgi:hypothetical protein